MRGQVDPLHRLEVRRRSHGAPCPGQIIGYTRKGRPVRLQAGGTGPAVLQHASATQNFTSGTSGTLSPAFGSGTTPGTTLVACITVYNDIGVTAVSSVTTNGAAENWAQAVEDASGSAFGWWDKNTGGGQTVIDISVTFGATSTANDSTIVTVDIYEVAGLGATPAIDQTGKADGSLVTSWSSGNITTTQPSEIAFGLDQAQASSAFTQSGPSSPWVNQAALTITGTQGGGSIPYSAISGYNILSSTGTVSYAGTTTQSAVTATVIFSIIASAAAAAPAAPALLIPPGRMSPMAFGFTPNPQPAPHADYDTGTAAESASVAVSDSDTGSGAEGQSVTQGASDSDAGTAAEASTIAATLAAGDTGTGAESSAITAALAGSDTATAAESASVIVQIPVSSSDSGTGSEAASAIPVPVVLWRAADKLSKRGGTMT